MICRPQDLIVLCEFILNSSRDQHLPAEEALYHTLIQLYLSGDSEPTMPVDQDPSASIRPSIKRFQYCLRAMLSLPH